MEYNDSELKKQLYFRINIWCLWYAYDAIKEVVNKDDIKKILSREEMYKILGTNRTDYANYKNGKKRKASSTMMKVVKENEYIEKALDGEKLLIEDQTFEEYIHDMIEMEKKGEEEKANKYFNEKIIPKIKKGVNIQADNSGKSAGYWHESKCIYWFSNKMGDYARGARNIELELLEDRVKQLCSINISLLDECDVKGMKECSDKLKKFCRKIDTIVNYKQLFEDRK